MTNTVSVGFEVNGERCTVEVDPRTPLVYILRNHLKLTGTKLGCALEQCGACRVLVDGEPTYSCTTPVSALSGTCITTIEGLADGEQLSALQQSFAAHRAAQCGYCTAGMLITASALLAKDEPPALADVRAALEPHLCRCGAHPRIERAVMSAAEGRS